MSAAIPRLCQTCRSVISLHKNTRSLCVVQNYTRERYDRKIRQDVEKLFKIQLKEHDAKLVNRKPGQEKYYVLSMFPYPSGKLHMGHVRVYTISDVMARYHRLRGKYVIHPIGWDAFGLPAENAAIERGEIAEVWTKKNIAAMKSQLDELCLSFDWKDEFATCDPEYYKWTQYLFLKMHEKGLIYQKMGQVNWDPVDQTVLADEQIDEDGCSWRSGAKVEKRHLKQWFIRTTAYTKSLVDGLSEVKSDLWRDVIDLQRNWLGTCDGTRLEFEVQCGEETLSEKLSVFTDSPECIYGASHILLSKDHYFNNEQYYKQDTSQITAKAFTELTIKAVSPLTDQLLPIVVDQHWTQTDNIDSSLGIPAIDENALALAQKLSLPFTEILDDSLTLRNSDEFTGLSRPDAFEAVTEKARDLGCGGDITSKTARDWLISRQRFWGTPIPIIHCPKHGALPVPYEDLPVTLPKVLTLTGKGQSPLCSAEDWLKVKCPGCDCDSHGERETDTMDTFVDSSWYFLRYLDSKNTDEPFSADKAATYMPVDLYIGGKEHATMHLYYARFFNHFLHNLGKVPEREPFHNLLTQGLVKGLSYYVERTNKFIHPDQVVWIDNLPYEKDTGEQLQQKWSKMSKSKHNGVDPQDILNEYGCDATRLSILSNVAPKSDRNWDTDVFPGVINWQSRIWRLVRTVQKEREISISNHHSEDLENFLTEITEIRNYFVNEVTHHMEKTFLLSVAISRLQGLTNSIMKMPVCRLAGEAQCERTLGELVIMMAPYCPMFAMALWEDLRATTPHLYEGFLWDKSVWEQHWPEVDKDYKLSLKIKIDNRSKFSIPLCVPLGEEKLVYEQEALSMALAHPDIIQHLKGKKVREHDYEVEPGLRVQLSLYTKRKSKKPKLV